ALLSLVLALPVAVGGLGPLTLEEQQLNDAFVGVDLGWQRGGVGKLEGDVALPAGLQGRYVRDYAAPSVRRLPERHHHGVVGDPQVLDRSCQHEAVGRDDADVLV